METTTILLPDGPCWSVSTADVPSMVRFLDEFNRRIDADEPEGRVRLRACFDSLVSRLGVEECEAALARFKAGERAPAPAAGGGNIAHQSSNASSSTTSSSSASARMGAGPSSSNSSQAPVEEAAAAGTPGAAAPGKQRRHMGVAVATASADFAGAGVDALSFPSVGQPPPQLSAQAAFHHHHHHQQQRQQPQQQWSSSPEGAAAYGDANSGSGSQPGLSPTSITWTNHPLQHQPSPPSGEGVADAGGGGGLTLPPITWRFGDITKTVTATPDAPTAQAEPSPRSKRFRAGSPVDGIGAGAGIEMHAQQQQQEQQQSGLPPLPPHHLPAGGAAGMPSMSAASSTGPAWPPYLTVTAASPPAPAMAAQQPSPSASAAASTAAASSGDSDGDESLQSGGGSGSGGGGGAKSGSGSGGSGGKGRPAAHNFGRYGDHLPYNGRKICRVKGCTGNQRWPDYLCGQHGGGRCRWEGCSLFHQGINSMGLLLCGKHCKAVGATYRRPSKGGGGGGGGGGAADSKKQKTS